MRKLLICVGSLLSLAGCVVNPPLPGHDTSYSQMAAVPLPPGPREFQEGYADGCGSGNAEAGFLQAHAVRDWASYQANSLYKQGWDEGHTTCLQAFLAFIGSSKR
jgi:hypothetical protein